MEYDRHDKMKSVLMEVVATFIREEANTDPLITVTNVLISTNFREVTVFITTIPDSKEANALIFLRRKGTELREYLKKNARLKYIPHINFEIDYGERHRQHIDVITQKIEKKP
jgi:ribosome-binding factor A